MKMLQQAVGWMGAPFLERYTRRHLLQTTFEEMWIRVSPRHKVYAHLHRPVANGPYPGVVFVPGALSPGTVYDGGAALSAGDVASLGYVALHYDPGGRGRSGGEEDYWGVRHQDELAAVATRLAALDAVDRHRIAILSFSIGISIAAGALARGDISFVNYLFDWEGPSNRYNITKNDSHPLLKAFPTADVDFWKEREAVRFIPEISCGYFRYQAQRDHMQGSFKGHAVELVNAAIDGRPQWARLNDNPMDTRLNASRMDEYRWVPWYRDHKGRMLAYLIGLPWSGQQRV